MNKLWFLLIFLINLYFVSAIDEYIIETSQSRAAEIYIIAINGTNCAGINDTAIYDGSNELNFTWHNSSMIKLAFIGTGVTTYTMNCSTDGLEHNSTNKEILKWIDCDGSFSNASDWDSQGGSAVSCQSGVVYSGSESLQVLGTSSATMSSLNFPTVTSDVVTMTGWWAKKSGGSGYTSPILSDAQYEFTTGLYLEIITGVNQDIRFYDTDYRDTGFDSTNDLFQNYVYIANITSDTVRIFQNDSEGTGANFRTVTSDLDYFSNRAGGTSEGFYIDDWFICKGICRYYTVPSTYTVESSAILSIDNSTLNMTSDGGCIVWRTDKTNICNTTDGTPTVTFDTNLVSFCSMTTVVHDYNVSSICSTTGSTSHICTLINADKLSFGLSDLHLACNTTTFTDQSGAMSINMTAGADGVGLIDCIKEIGDGCGVTIEDNCAVIRIV